MKRQILSSKGTSLKRRRLQRPSWLWRWHHLLSGFVLFFGVGMALASLQYTPQKFSAQAAGMDNVLGWLWSDPAGWISLNSDNPLACFPGPCGSYGVTIDPVTRQMTGFGWSDVTGWVCFGATCAANPMCDGVPPVGPLKAFLDPGPGTVALRGWAKVCNAGDDGWISLNCADAGPGVCANVAPYYRVVFNPSTGMFSDLIVPGTSFAWNGTLNGQGLGYIDFSHASLKSEQDVPQQPQLCADGIDNDLNGLKDCQDQSCNNSPSCGEIANQNLCKNGIDENNNGKIDCQDPGCAQDPVCKEDQFATDFQNKPLCSNNVDDDGNGLKDCQEMACQQVPTCMEDANNGNVCLDGLDNDGNGQTDCADAKCANHLGCKVNGEAAMCNGDQETCCSDTQDNDLNGKVDCQDMACANAQSCGPWIQAKFGDVYAKEGIQVSGSKSNGTYCLTSNGAIVGMSSGNTCVESGEQVQNISLPSDSSNYQGTLGTLDIQGILNGKYGNVDTSGIVLPVLGGKVYHVKGDYVLNATMFQNGNGPTQRGNGLLLVEGNLTIAGNLSYQTNALTKYLRNLASFGVIVKKVGQAGGNIFIQPNVTQMVGAYFAEGTIDTGTLGKNDQPLQVFGLMAAHKFNLVRSSIDPTKPSELIVFDGRAAANPPPGMQAVAHSLPVAKNAF